MSTVTVYYGHAYDGKNEAIFAQCLERIRRHEGQTCVYLVRTDVRVRQLREIVFRECGGCFQFPVTTFPDFIKTLYRNSSDAKCVLSPLEQKLLLEDLLRQRERECNGRFYFRRFREYPGITAKIHEFISGMRRVDIASPQELTAKLRGHSAKTRQVQAELAGLFQRYVDYLETAGMIDDTGIFLEISRRAASGQLNLRAAVESPELLVLEGYYELTPPEQRILSSLCERFDRTVLTLDIPINPYEFAEEAEDTPKPFRIFSEVVRYIRASGFSLREFSGKSISGADKMPPSTTLRTSAFPEIPPERLSVRVYRDRKEEVTAIAKEIRRLSRNGGITALREVGVTFPIIETYEQLIREIFPLFGIPFTMVQGYALAASPVVVTVFRLLQVVLENYRREALINLFASPLVQYETALHADTTHQLDSLARVLGIIEGRDQWTEQLTRALAEGLNSDLPGFENLAGLDPLMTTPVLLTEVLSFLQGVADFESEAPRQPEELIDLLITAIQRLQMPVRILQAPDHRILEQDAAALRKFMQVLETLQQVFRRRGTTDPLSLRQFADMLRSAVQGESYYLPGTLQDSVFVIGRLDTRQVQFRYLFFGGLVERDFPGQDDPHIFVSEQEAEMLGLPTYKNRLQETDHLFYLNLLNPTHKLYLSYPLQEGDTELLKATHLDHLSGVQDLSCEGEQDESCTPDERPWEEMFTYSDLYQWLGKQLTQTAQVPGGEKEVLRFIEAEKGAEVVAHFLTGLEAQQLRMANSLSRFDGMLASTWIRNTLRNKYARHIYAVSEFDQYLRCPMQFLFQRILHLEPLQDVVAEISTIDAGRLLHRIVYRFYAQDESCTPGAGNVAEAFLRRKSSKEAWIQEAQERMARIVHEELQSYKFSGVFWDHLVESLLAGLNAPGVQDSSCVGVQDFSCRVSSPKKGLLAAFIELEANASEKMWPGYLEAHFGMPEEEGYNLSPTPFRLRVTDEAGKTVSIPVRGKIDRIDIEPLPATGKRRAVVYDYKTGSLPPVVRLKEGRSFQLPLYLLAAQDLLGERYEVVAGGYYLLRSPKELGKRGHLGSKEYAEQNYFSGRSQPLLETQTEVYALLNDYIARSVSVVDAIEAGRFHPTLLKPQEAGCEYCAYRQICRVDYQRMEHVL